MEIIKIDDILRVYSNVALNNAKFIANINNKDNKKIETINFEEHLILNKEILNKISNFNKKAEKNNEYLIEEETFKKNLCIYLRDLRNFYSHHPDETLNNNHLKAKDSLGKNEENFQKEFKKTFWSTSYFSFFETFDKFDWRIYIISLFLTNLEFREMIENFENKKIKINKYIDNESPLRNLRFRFNIYKYQEPIETKLLNYIKNFNEIKNYKKSFANQAISLLNWKYKNEKIKFEKKINKGHFLFSLNFIEDETNFMFNFSQLRRILFFNKETFKSKINKFKNKTKNSKNNQLISDYELEYNKQKNLNSDDFESFQNRFKTEKIDKRHLLKILNKILNKKYNLIIKQKHFEDLFKDLIFENTNKENILFLKKSQEEEEIKKIIEILKINKEEEQINMLSKIKDFIYKEINSKENFDKIFNKKSKLPKQNPISKNQELMFLNIEEDLREIIKKKFYDYVSHSSKLKNKKIKSNFREFLIPLIIFYENNIDDKKNSLNIEEILNKDEDYVIENKLIVEIFKNKISKNKDYKVYYTFDKNKSLTFKNKLNEIVNSNRELISSKLFLEFCKLLNIEKIEHKGDWKKVIDKLNWYKEKEILLCKEIYDKHKKWIENYEQKKYRDYIFHRSISKFKKFEKFEEYVNDKTIKKSTPDFSKNR